MALCKVSLHLNWALHLGFDLGVLGGYGSSQLTGLKWSFCGISVSVLLASEDARIPSDFYIHVLTSHQLFSAS